MYSHRRTCSKTRKMVWFYPILRRSSVPRTWDSPLSGASCVLARWVCFGELSSATESSPSALQAARESSAGPARRWSVGRISLFISYFLLPPCPVWFAWPRAPAGLLSSFSPGMSSSAFSVTHFKIWAKKLWGKLMWYLLFLRRLGIQAAEATNHETLISEGEKHGI